eukprot:TRINITY_DN10760_c0_g1_i1.p1 TRINITY_DN10760_c0_g1~~TRINITY_DN10760_c0_g1_i1.p1  ORF type:complete len:269 (+),score=85.84 TRINITY_DN10760_c0_g1_i1:104-910(+)
MIRRPPRSTLSSSSAASDVYKRQTGNMLRHVQNRLSGHQARKIVTLISGKPGGGKGTISKKLIKDFDCVHISTGDILRKHVAGETELGLQVKAYMAAGKMAPTELVADLVFVELEELEGKLVLLDGFPRTLEQGRLFTSKRQIDVALDIVVPDEEIVKRASMRWVHPGSGRVYAYDYNPPKEEGKDDETGESLVQRDDDKPETVQKRLQEYRDVTLPLSQFFVEKGVHAEFDGLSRQDLIDANKRSDAIYAELKPHFERQLNALGYKA